MKTKLLSFLLLLSCAAFSQTNLKFYKTIEDYAKDNSIPGYDIVPNSNWENSWTGEKMYVLVSGKEEKMKPVEFPGDFYTDNKGHLWRRYKNETFVLLVFGDYCYYMSTLGFDPVRHYSETISGPIKKFNEGVFEKKLKEKSLFEAYKKDKPKREFRDSPSSYFTKIVERDIKYAKLLNGDTEE